MTKFKKFIIIIFILAFLVRLIYVVNVPYQEYQHDVEPNGNGLSYIFTIVETGKLPESNAGQFYHPPLHQIIAAVWIKVVNIFTDNFEIQCESLQFLTLIYSLNYIITGWFLVYF